LTTNLPHHGELWLAFMAGRTHLYRSRTQVKQGLEKDIENRLSQNGYG